MSNQISIDVFERNNLRTGDIDYCIAIYDDYDETTLFVAREDIPDDDLELLKNVIKFKHQDDIFGGDSCRVIQDVLDYIEEHECSVNIGNHYYSYDEMKDVLKYDFREVYFCPKCNWESTDDVDYDVPCLRYGCNGHMSQVREEWYEK